MFDRDGAHAPQARQAQGGGQSPGGARPSAAAARDRPVLSRPLRVLAVHAFYRQPGGEDAVFAAETALLERAGHVVERFTRDNQALDEARRLAMARDTVWSRTAAAEFDAVVQRFRPDVVHAHNLFPAISPAVAWVARRRRVPFVLTLHNYRLLCPQAMFLRDARVCEDCLGRVPLPAIRHRCYRGSAAASAVVAAMLVAHRGLGTWRRCVERYVALGEFARGRFVAGGFPAARIAVKPNFVDDPGDPGGQERSSAVLFVGRLSEDKGVGILADAARRAPEVAIRVAGEGPAAGRLVGLPNVRRLGRLDAAGVLAEMRAARALVVPSLWYEGLPRVLVEACASGLPVIASALGSLAEHVIPERTGWLVPPGDGDALAAALRVAAGDAPQAARLGRGARAAYEASFTAARTLEALLGIYDDAIAARRAVPEGR